MVLSQILFTTSFTNCNNDSFLKAAEELRIVDILGKLGDLQINALMVQADIPINKISAILFELEMKGVIRVLAGGVYQLLR